MIGTQIYERTSSAAVMALMRGAVRGSVARVLDEERLAGHRDATGDALAGRERQSRDGVLRVAARGAHDQVFMALVPDQDHGLVGAQDLRDDQHHSAQHVLELERLVQQCIGAIERLHLAVAAFRLGEEPSVVDGQGGLGGEGGGQPDIFVREPRGAA